MNTPNGIHLLVAHLLFLLSLCANRGSLASAEEVYEDSITAIPSTGNYLLYENITTFSQELPESEALHIQSDVPLTIQRYLSDQGFLGGEPLDPNTALVVVSSSCDTTSDTIVIPVVELVKAGNDTILSIKVGVSSSEEEASDMPFLDSSSYEAIWYEAGCPMPDFPSTTTTATTSTGSTTDDTTQPTMATTTSLTELGSDGMFYTPCASESACNTRRQELDIPRFEVGEFPMKGCFSKNDIAYWSIGGTKEEELREELPGSQERIWCTMADDASLFPTPSSTTIPTTTTTSTTTTATSSSSSSTATELPTIVVTRVGGTSNVPTMITTTTTEEGTSDVPTMITTTTTTEESSSNVPTTITTEVGSGTFVVPKTCATELECDTRRQQLDILRFEVGEFPTKGCFTKNGIAFWSTGGTVEEEMREDLPGIQERIWCDDDAEEDDSFTTSAIGDPCEIGPSADATKSCAGTGEFCELDVGVCNTKVAVFEGTCTAIPQACTLNYVPVCGCDGETYGNACAAQGAGVSVSYDGECTTDEGTSISNVTACETGPSADPTKSCGDGQFCELDTGVCNAKTSVFDGVCTNIPTECTFELRWVCGCDGESYGNACAAQGAGVSISREGKCTEDTTDDEVTTNQIACMTKMDCDKARQQAGYAKFNVGAYPSKGCFHKNGIAFWGTGGTIAQKSRYDLPGIQTRLYCEEDVVKADSACQTQAECNQKRLQLGITTFQTGDFPTKGCFSKPGVAFWGSGGTSEEISTYDLPGLRERIWCDDSQCETGPSANPAKSCGENLFCKLDSGVCNTKSAVFDGMCAVKPVACQEIYAPVCGCDDVTYSNVCDAHSQGINVSGQGKCPEGRSSDPLLQQALESQVDYTDLASSACSIKALTIGSVLQSAFATQPVPKSPPRSRDLQTCTYNVEVFVSGCTYFGPPAKIKVAAPKARVIDSIIENVAKEKINSTVLENTTEFFAEEYKYTTTFTFPDEEAQLIDTSDGNFASVPSAADEMCARIVCGRPFIDFSGNSLLATSISSDVCDGTSSWLGDTATLQSLETQSAHDGSNNQHRLGEEWTRNALGEHASVASFAAFSIALMTNQAPSDLVEDSLKAALDEVRHAKMSFVIASMLEGTDVTPGPLPPSNHHFDHDMTALALSVATEGCVDETLSALAAAAEVEIIGDVLEYGAAKGTKYYDIASELLIRIRNDLQTISMDESNHSALAWRTLDWVCMVDTNACDAAKHNVLSEYNLMKAFQRRFGRDFKAPAELLDRMMVAWKNIYSSQKILPSFNVTTGNVDEPASAVGSSSSIITLLVENVSNGGIYNRL